MSIVIPTEICHFGWRDFRGGLFYAFFARIIFNYHITALVNSWSHWSGSQPYTEKITARNTSPILGLFTAGEAYHNFHHRFPSDYRNGIRWFDMDSSKWFISLCEKLGLASKLIRTSKSDIELAKRQTQGGGFIGSGVPEHHKSPFITWEDYKQMCLTGRCLVSISGRVYDITTFLFDHPGGQETLQKAIGIEATDVFNSIDHSSYALSILSSLHIGMIDSKQD
ncbi:acyl-CoA desaturase [Penicillium waksmanii]|uniref:acyl-CoA desaturase n=1 Tax=Penicillium waksmanii TaxID=69791 RepID=UPI002546BA9D|nr:acyl-CoA desaturase [Penicillium waksmanii]KAJ5974248.1 acyl-CoA desaturase [Penicillium waksmanii]